MDILKANTDTELEYELCKPDTTLVSRSGKRSRSYVVSYLGVRRARLAARRHKRRVQLVWSVKFNSRWRLN